MKIVRGLLLGAIGGPLAVMLVGGVWGAFARPAPCHSAPDPASGAFFGALVLTYVFGIPAIVIGMVASVVIPKLSYRFSMRALLIAVAIFAVLLGWLVLAGFN